MHKARKEISKLKGKTMSEEMLDWYTLAISESGKNIELVSLTMVEPPSVGSKFDRDPVLHEKGKWTIIKVFEGQEFGVIDGMMSMGLHDAVHKLFKINTCIENQRGT